MIGMNAAYELEIEYLNHLVTSTCTDSMIVQ